MHTRARFEYGIILFAIIIIFFLITRCVCVYNNNIMFGTTPDSKNNKRFALKTPLYVIIRIIPSDSSHQQRQRRMT